MKNLIISLSKGEKKSVYISVQKRPELLARLHHKLRVKSAIYGYLVTVYCPDMNFENALKSGWSILEDNRDNYVHNITIVPTYSRKKKQEKKCFYCGEKLKKDNVEEK